MRWEDLRFYRDDVLQNRLRWIKPDDPEPELAFLDLPASIMALVAGPLGVTMQCVNHHIYHLSTETTVDDVIGWLVRDVLRV